MKANRILMKKPFPCSNNPQHIEGIGISDGTVCRVYAVSDLYDYIKNHPDMEISVENSNAYLQPVMSISGEKYICSAPNLSITDALMRLQRI